MSTEKILHGQMIDVDAKGNIQILHQETSASDVKVDNSANTQGTGGSSTIPVSVDTLQKLINYLGSLAFKNGITLNDFDVGIIANDYNTTEAGKILDARRGKDLNDRLSTIENEDILGVGTDTESTDYDLPESEINDEVVSLASTWSSDKLNEILQQIIEDTHVFYVPLVENADGSYTAQKSVEEIEEAYQASYPVWVVASEIFIPLRQRVDATHWIFSGYADGQAYDIQISNTGVTVTYKEIASLNDALPNPNVLRLTGRVNAVYDGSEEVEVEIPVVIKDKEIDVDTTWSSDKIDRAISTLESELQHQLDSHKHNWDDLENKPFGVVASNNFVVDCEKVRGQMEAGEVTIANETHVHISDSIVSIDDLADGITIVKNGVSETIAVSDCITLATGVCATTNETLIFVTEEGVGTDINGEGKTFAKAGIYLDTTYLADAESISITIPNYTGFSAIKTLDPIYIPNYSYGEDGGDYAQDISIELDKETHLLTVFLKNKNGQIITQASASLEGIGDVKKEDLAPVATSGSFNDLRHKPSTVLDVDDEGVLSLKVIYSTDETEYLTYDMQENETGLDVAQAVNATVNNNELEVI